MTVLVTGANGQLGCWLRLVAAEPGFRYLFSDISDLSEESREMLRKLGGKGVDLSTVRLDVTDLSAIREMVKNEGVGAIVNCAAFTNVDAAESQPETAELLNVKAPGYLAVAMHEMGGLLVHVSTDYIFGGTPCDRPIPEDFPAAPLGVYGRTKWEGEEAIRRVGCRHVILRTAWLFSEFGKNFVRTMLRLTAERPQVKVVNDQRGTPTYAADLAGVILQILSAAASPGSSPSFAGLTGESQTFNYTNSGECTWYDFACAIYRTANQIRQAKKGIAGSQSGNDARPSSAGSSPSSAGTSPSFAGLTGESPSCEILPCRSEEFPSPVRRPAYSVLDKTKIKAALDLEIPEWQDGLRRCLASLA